MRLAKWLVIAIGLVAVSPSQARAGFLTGFTGNTDFVTGAAAANGTVNFAVYFNDPNETVNGSSTNWATKLGVSPSSLPSAPAVDPLAQYVYFYEVVNTGGGDDLDSFQVPENGHSYTSAGFVDDTVFFDGTSPINGSNPSLPDGHDLNAQASAFAIDSGAINPIDAGDNGSFMEFEFGVGTSGDIPAGSFSAIVFATSNLGPLFANGILSDGGQTSDPIASHGAPEPGSLLVWGGLLAIGATVAARRRCSRKAA